MEWSRPWDTVLDWQPPDAKWFIGGKINASVNCVDRHALGSRRDKRAIVWEGEPGDQKTLTYGELHVEVQKCANVLKRSGCRPWRPGGGVPADGPGAAYRDARLRADRRGA